jgi:hypothetical protein
MPLTTDVLELVALFNGQKTDLPDGVLSKHCVFRLNGRAYHEHLGRPPDDPLVRLIGCGAAGYRFVLTAVRRAMHEPRIALHEGSIVEAPLEPGARLQARGTLSGRLRGGPEGPFAVEFLIEVFASADGQVGEMAATLGDADVEILLDARRKA